MEIFLTIRTNAKNVEHYFNRENLLINTTDKLTITNDKDII